MKRMMKALARVLMIFAMMICLDACGKGANIITDVTLEDDFSGSRIMEVSISKSAFDQYFTGTIEELAIVIKENCPKELKYKISETDTSILCTFNLEFDSVDTYKEKVFTILGEECEIIAVKADTFLSQGISYQEDFESMDLLGWFDTALVENNHVSSSHKSDIFESDTTTLVFASKEYDTTNYINVSDVQYMPFGNIDILTKPYYDNTYDRVIVFNIPKSTMDQKNDEIVAYLEEGVPTNATMEWGTNIDSEETVFTITMHRLNPNELTSSMQSVFYSETANLEGISYTGEANMLEHGQALKETIDVTKFMSNANATAHVRYFVSSDTQPVAEKINLDGKLSMFYYSNWIDDYEGYDCVFDDDTSQITISLNTKISYIPDTINLATHVKGGDKFKRNIELVYNNVIEENESLQLQESINKAIEGFAESKYTEEDNGYKITLKQSGTEEEVNLGFQTIFNTTKSYVRYARQRSKASFALASVFEEKIFIDDFFGNEIDNIQINYEAKLSSGEKISKATIKSYSDDSSVAIKGNSFVTKADNGRINCSLAASKFNFFALIWWLLILIFIAAIAMVGYMGFLKFNETTTSADTEATKGKITGKEIKSAIKRFYFAFMSKAKHLLHKKQCSTCNAYIDESVKYCTKCGVKIEESENNN